MRRLFKTDIQMDCSGTNDQAEHTTDERKRNLLDCDNAGKDCWLVKVPIALSNIWQASHSEHVGTWEMSLNHSEKTVQCQYTATEDLVRSNGMIPPIFTMEFPMKNEPIPPMAIISQPRKQADLNGYHFTTTKTS